MGARSATYIVVNLRFAALHCWPAAPPEVKFLRDYHRHEFHVKVALMVKHVERESETWQFKAFLRGVINDLCSPPTEVPFRNVGSYSCEQIAEVIATEVAARYQDRREVEVEVLEDGETGALHRIF